MHVSAVKAGHVNALLTFPSYFFVRYIRPEFASCTRGVVMQIWIPTNNSFPSHFAGAPIYMPGNASWNYNRRRRHNRWKVRTCNKFFCGPPSQLHRARAFRIDLCIGLFPRSRRNKYRIRSVPHVCGRGQLAIHMTAYESYRLMLTELS